jgi:hypothetical protein
MLDPDLERKTRHRASNRGFQIIRIGGREGKRRRALGIAPNMLIDHERVHLFAATMRQIDEYIAAFPERPSLLHDDQRQRLKASGLDLLVPAASQIKP